MVSSEYVFKVEPIKFAHRLDVGCREREGLRITPRFLTQAVEMKLHFTKIQKNAKGAGMEVEWNIGKSVSDTSHLTCLLYDMTVLSR